MSQEETPRENPRVRAQKLVALAMDRGTEEEERTSAAMKAVALIHKHGLLSSPLDILDMGNETVRAAKSVAETILDPSFRKDLKKTMLGLGGAVRRKRRR